MVKTMTSKAFFVSDDMRQDIRIKKIEAWAFREPTARAVATSFGVMRDRPAVFVRIEDQDGCFGFGEIFANWPVAAAEYRVNLLAHDIAPLILNVAFASPSEVLHSLTAKTSLVALQSGDYGSFRQVIAGLDTAVWDLCARKAGKPLAEYLNTNAPSTVPAYASGIHIDAAEKVIDQSRTWGFTRFKVKVGFSDRPESEQVNTLAAGLFKGETLMADANQAWPVETAMEFMSGVRNSSLSWLEEPIRADASSSAWQDVMNHATVPIAAGENLVGFDEFSTAIRTRRQDILQPDVAKWGGITGCMTIAKRALENGINYCPHFLGGGIGLAASAHLLAASESKGWLEVDVNPNHLRDAFEPVSKTIRAGAWPMNSTAGLGISNLPESLAPLQTAYQAVS